MAGILISTLEWLKHFNCGVGLEEQVVESRMDRKKSGVKKQ